jgi:ABC-2 type transport system permease protein
VNVDLSSEAVPTGVDTLILNGPTETYREAALYRIDQFVMDGGSLLVFLDRHVQIIPTQQEMMMGAQPTWEFNRPI